MFGRTRRIPLAAALALVVVTAAACSSDSSGPSPSPSTGSTYTMTGVTTLANLGGGGPGLPVTFTDGAGKTLKFENGSLVLEADGTYNLTVNVVYKDDAYDAGDLGTYSMEGNTVSLNSTLDDGSYTAVVAGSALTVTYRVKGINFDLAFQAD